MLEELCGGDKTAQIKFDFRILETSEVIHSMTTTVADLEGGNTILNGNGGAQITIQNFQLRQKPKFVDYLRSGW